MTAQPCLTPGLAQRSATYHQEVERARLRVHQPDLNRLKIDKALALGTAEELTPQERCLMMALLAHLDIGSTAKGQTAVWPGSKRLCALLGLGESTLRRLKGSLEEKGFLLRRYDRCNRPLKGGALDLSPFLSRVDAICERIGHTDRKVAALADKDRSERCDHRPEESAGEPGTERLNGKTQQEISERRVPAEGGGKGAPNHALELAEALCPGILQDPQKTAASTMGEEKAARLWHWAEKRHGPAAVLALAIAGRDPSIKNPSSWFAWFATSAAAGEVDLNGRLQRLPKAPKPITAPALQGPSSERLLAEFSKAAGADAAASYLSGAVTTTDQGALVLRVPRRLAASRLEGQWTSLFRDVALAEGYQSFRLCHSVE